MENHVNFKRLSLPESTYMGTEKNPKLKASDSRTAVALLNIQTGIEINPLLLLEQICTFGFFFNQHSSLMDGMNESALLCTD